MQKTPVSSRQERILEVLRSQIKEGRWSYGAALPSENDLAHSLGVSRGTLRGVLAELENEGIIRRERGRGTFVARVPGSGERTGQRSLAFIVPYIRDSFAYTILLGFESVARGGGWAVQFNHVENNLANQETALRAALRQGVSGVALYPVSSREADPALRELISRHFPLVLVDRYLVCEQTDCVMSDHFGGAIAAMRYMIGLGHRRIVFVSSRDPAVSIEHRRLAYRQALVEAAIPFDPLLEWEVEGYPEIDEEALADRLAQVVRPCALFCANDQLAVAVQRVARRLQMAIPGDLSMVGFDDLDIASHLEIPLTTVHQPAFDIGKNAAEMLLARIRSGPGRPELCVLPVQLVIRRSCESLTPDGEKGGISREGN